MPTIPMERPIWDAISVFVISTATMRTIPDQATPLRGRVLETTMVESCRRELSVETTAVPAVPVLLTGIPVTVWIRLITYL